MATYKHFISRVASGKWHSEISRTNPLLNNNSKSDKHYLLFSRTFFFRWFQTTQASESSRKKIVFSMSFKIRKLTDATQSLPLDVDKD